MDVLEGLNAGAAARGRGRARAGLHPRRRRLGEDDDDHAADRLAGRFGRVRARTRSSRSPSPTRPRARCARGWRGSARTASRRARSTRRRWRSCGGRAAKAPGRILSTKALLLRQIGEHAAAAVPVPAGRRPRDRGRVGEEPAADPADLPRRARGHEPPIPDDLMAPRLPRVRAAQGRRRARSTSRTCSS